MRTSSNVNPLITNFMTPQQPQVVSADEVKVIYDPKSQITLFMGGGGRRGPSRSYDGYKATPYWVGHTCNTKNDAERWTDD